MIESGKINESGQELPDNILKLIQDAVATQLNENKKTQEAASVVMPEVPKGAMSQQQMIEAFAAAIRLNTKGDEMVSPYHYIRPEDIDKDDFDKDGILFHSYSAGYLIVDDKRNGHSVKTPYGNQIMFIHQGTKKTRDASGKFDVVNLYASYRSHSKKEIQWLRDHTLYGLMFHEDASLALNADVVMAQRLMKHVTAIESMDASAFHRACEENKVPATADIKAMKMALAYKVAQREVEEEENNREIKFAAMNEELQFTGK